MGTLLASYVVATNDLKADASCFIRDSRLGGSKSGVFIDDLAMLQEVVTVDTRLWGFQICIEQGSITGFRLKVADNYGTGNFVDLNPIGPGTQGCGRYKLGDPLSEPI